MISLFLLVESSSRGFGVHFQRARSVLEIQAPDEGEGQKTVLLLSLSEEEADASVVGPHLGVFTLRSILVNYARE
jgi:hypothetical protein